SLSMKKLKYFPSTVLLRASIAIAAFASISATSASTQSYVALRPPAVPLVACDPYFSIWSPADKLTDADTVHWTGKPHRLTSLVRIDGKGFRLMGKEPADVPALPQTNLEVLPTRTIYTFEGEGVRLALTFMTPALPDDLDILGRPVTYVTVATRTTDQKQHVLEFELSASGELTVNDGKQLVVMGLDERNGLAVLMMGSEEQPVLAKKGDDLRIDWGQFFLTAPASPDTIPRYLNRPGVVAVPPDHRLSPE